MLDIIIMVIASILSISAVVIAIRNYIKLSKILKEIHDYTENMKE